MTTNPSTAAPATRSAAAERLRRHRQRRRDGFLCVTIELSKAEIDTLIRRGFLERETRNNPRAVRDALYAFYATHWVEYTTLRQAVRNA
jgi:hypothetical protein